MCCSSLRHTHTLQLVALGESESGVFQVSRQAHWQVDQQTGGDGNIVTVNLGEPLLA